MNSVYRTYWQKDPPARATVQAGLPSDPYSIEVTMVVVKGGGRTAVTTTNADGTPGRVNPNLSSAIRVGNLGAPLGK